MTAYSWKAGSGDWNVAANWSPAGGPPKSTDTATINGTAATTITVDTADVASSLTLSAANATLNDDGASASLTIGGTLTMSNGTLNLSADGAGGVLTVGALNLSGGTLNVDNGGQLKLNGTLSQTGGTLTLNSGGTISGGTIKSAAGTLTLNGGALSAVTYDGTLDLSGSSAWVHLANGTVVKNAVGTGAGTINDTGINSSLYFDNTQTVSNTTINLGNSSNYSYLYEYDPTSAGNQVLTLASSVTVDVQGYAYIQGSGASGDGIVNKGVIEQTGGYGLVISGNAFTNSGTIDAKAASASLSIQPTTFTNSGTLDVASGDTVYIAPTTFATTAASVIKIEANSSVTIEPTNAWTNLGSITLASGASLYLYGSVSAASLGSITNSGGTVYVGGTWNNTGHTLNGSASFGQLALYGGTISGGTVTSTGVGFAGTGTGTLSGVTFDGPLNLTATSASVHLANGTKVVGSSGSGPGTINDTGIVSFLYFDNTQTVSNTTINLGNSSNYSYLYEYDPTSAGNQLLTLASSVTVDVQGNAYIQGSGASGDGIVNKGVIDQTGSGGQLVIYAMNAFTNSGTIDAKAASGSLNIEPNTFTNSGTIDVANGDTVYIAPTTLRRRLRASSRSKPIHRSRSSRQTPGPTSARSR